MFGSINDFQIYKSIEDKFIDLFERLNKYSLVITGTIGSGKSTICDIISSYVMQSSQKNNISLFPEFISKSEVGKNMLEQKLNGKISPETFQHYIADYWNDILHSKNQNIKIFERAPDDGVICFCNIDNKTKNLPDKSFLDIYEKTISINNKYNAPSYFSNNINFSKINSLDINTNLMEIANIIDSDIKNNITCRIIGLSVSCELSMKRINNRSRNGEENYSESDIKMYVDLYENLYKKLEYNNGLKRFIDIGSLL